MKNKGRKHLSGKFGANSKSLISHITRPVEKMSSSFKNMRGYSKKWVKNKWIKRIRGYNKTQHFNDIDN